MVPTRSRRVHSAGRPEEPADQWAQQARCDRFRREYNEEWRQEGTDGLPGPVHSDSHREGNHAILPLRRAMRYAAYCVVSRGSWFGKEGAMRRGELNYIDAGYLKGPAPRGGPVVVAHLDPGYTGFRFWWKGRWWARFGQEEMLQELGVPVREKKSGSQIGYPSEPVIKALWRNLVDRFNQGEPSVTYHAADPT